MAFATSRGFEAMRALKKGQGSLFRHLHGVAGEVSLVIRPLALFDQKRVNCLPQLAFDQSLQRNPSQETSHQIRQLLDLQSRQPGAFGSPLLNRR